jgi:hypothetical protein
MIIINKPGCPGKSFVRSLPFGKRRVTPQTRTHPKYVSHKIRVISHFAHVSRAVRQRSCRRCSHPSLEFLRGGARTIHPISSPSSETFQHISSKTPVISHISRISFHQTNRCGLPAVERLSMAIQKILCMHTQSFFAKNVPSYSTQNASVDFTRKPVNISIHTLQNRVVPRQRFSPGSAAVLGRSLRPCGEKAPAFRGV